jgi:hypothetical protein
LPHSDNHEWPSGELRLHHGFSSGEEPSNRIGMDCESSGFAIARVYHAVPEFARICGLGAPVPAHFALPIKWIRSK